MDGGNDGNFTQIYDGTGRPGQLCYLVNGLTMGQAYNFVVAAVNFNGEGAQSSEALLVACLPPSDLAPPIYVNSTQTTLTVSWSAPQQMSCCPLE
jgi:hypothetical protein